MPLKPQANSAIIITGGVEASTAAEVYDVSTGQHCRLTDLPNNRYWHTQVIFYNIIIIIYYLQNGNLACGGWETKKTCIQLVDGEWVTSHQLQTERNGHTSLRTSSGDDLLVGGFNAIGDQSTELVKIDGTSEVGTLQLKYGAK